MSEYSNYNAYRYHITRYQNHQLPIPFDIRSKELIMIDFFEKLIHDKKTVYKLGKKRFVIYGKQNVNQQIFVITLAKNIKEKKYVEGDEEPIAEEDESIVFVRMFVNPDTQIILVQHKSTAFQDTSVSIKYLSRFINDAIRDTEHVVNIYPLSSYENFWDTIERAEYIYRFSATLNAPNMLLGHQSTRDALKILKGETNIDSVKIDLISAEGKLELKKSTWYDKVIEHVTTVGGKLGLRYKMSEKTPVETKTELDEVRKVSIAEEETYSDFDLSNIEGEIKSIDEDSKTQDNEPNK